MPFATTAAFLTSILGAASPQNPITVAIAPSTAPSQAARFELGDGTALSIYTHSVPGGQEHHLAENEVVVFAEGDISSLPGRFLAGKNGHALYAMDVRTLNSLTSSQRLWLKTVTPESAPFSLLAPSRTPPLPTLGDTEAVAVDRTRLMNFLQTLTGQKPAKLDNGEVLLTDRASETNRQSTLAWLTKHFRDLGLEVRQQCYTGRNKGCNLEATQWGSDRSSSVVFSAHYDSVTRVAADDNGSGTAALMEIAQVLSGRALAKTVRFVMFDQEESGLIGSAAYVKSLDAAAEAYPAAAFNLDMIGYDADNDGKVHIIDCKRPESMPLTGLVLSAIGRAGVTLSKSETCTNRSDHASFWGRNIPAIIVAENFFGNDGNPCYHKICDTIEKMNLEYYFKISDTMATLAWGVANGQ